MEAVAEKTPEQLEQEAFEAEMQGTDVPKQEAPQPEPASTEQSTAQEQETEQPARVEVIPGYTKEELDATLAEIPKLRKALDSTNGTYGSRLADQQKRIDELTKQKQQVAEQAQKQVATMSLVKFEKLKNEFPELAELLEEDFKSVAIPAQQAQQPDFSPIEKNLDAMRQEFDQRLKQREARLLQKEHPDWKDLASYQVNDNGIVQFNNAAFGNWVANQSADVQKDILNSNDAFELSEYLTKFKQSLQPPAQQQQANKPNLEKAIQPKGVAPATRSLTPEEEEEAAFKATMLDPYS